MQFISKALERLIDFSLIAVEQLQLIVGNIVFYFDKLIKQPRLHNFGDRHLARHDFLTLW